MHLLLLTPSLVLRGRRPGGADCRVAPPLPVRRWVLVVAMLPLLALSACSPRAPEPDVTSVPRGLQSPFADEGAAVDRAAVRAVLVDTLSAAEDQLSRSADGRPLHSAAARSARLRDREAPALAARDLAASAYFGESEAPFRSARFVATDWQGVVVRGDHAKAYVFGHSRYRYWDGTGRAGSAAQFKALLIRRSTAPNGWIVVALRAAQRDQG